MASDALGLKVGCSERTARKPVAEGRIAAAEQSTGPSVARWLRALLAGEGAELNRDQPGDQAEQKAGGTGPRGEK